MVYHSSSGRRTYLMPWAMRSFFTRLILSPTCARKVAGSISNSSRRLQPSRIALMVPRVSPTASCSSAIGSGRSYFTFPKRTPRRCPCPRRSRPRRRCPARHARSSPGRAHGKHAVDSFDGMLDELAGVDLDLEARALADAVPQGLERRVERDVLLQLDRDLLGLVADLDPLGTCG